MRFKDIKIIFPPPAGMDVVYLVLDAKSGDQIYQDHGYASMQRKRLGAPPTGVASFPAIYATGEKAYWPAIVSLVSTVGRRGGDWIWDSTIGLWFGVQWVSGGSDGAPDLYAVGVGRRGDWDAFESGVVRGFQRVLHLSDISASFQQ